MKKTFKNIFGFKAFSVLLSLSLLLGALWCVPAFAEDEGTNVNVWDGKSADFTEAEGRGTKEDPYKISNGGQLFKMMTSQGKDAKGNGLYYEITEDIDLGGVSGGHNWKIKNTADTVTDGNYSFTGHLDGKGHTIKGMYLAADTDIARAALIPALGAGATVSNVIISGANINANAKYSYAAAITAELRGTGVVISNCFVDSESSFTATSKLGGIVASVGNNVPSVNNCGFAGTLQKSDGTVVTAGGIIGLAWGNNAKISNCYSVGAYPVNADNETNIQAYTCENIYTDTAAESVTGYSTYKDWLKEWVDRYATVLTTEEMTGVSAKANMSKFNFYTAWQAVENGYPVPRTTDCAEYTGAGTKKNPYVISTDAQLYALVNDTKTSGNYYELANDIVLNSTGTEGWYNTASQWVTAGDYTTTVFRGHLNGNNHTVSGLYIKTSDNATKIAGLFPVIGAGAVISNLKVNGAYLYGGNSNTSDYFFGAIAGAVNLSLSDKDTASDPMKWPTIVACGVEDATVNARFAGGIIGGGAGYAKIESSYSANLTLSNDAYTVKDANKSMNGIIGKSWNKNFYVKNCYTTYKTPYVSDMATNFYVLQNVSINQDGTIDATGLLGGTFNVRPGGASVPNKNLEYVHVSTKGDEEALAQIRSYILGDTDKYYIVDVNNNLQYVDICDLVYAALGE